MGTADLAAQYERIRTLVDAYQELADEGWRNTLADRLSSALGDALWTDIDHAWAAGDCTRLAAAARALAAAEGKLAKFDSILTAPYVADAVTDSKLASAVLGRLQTVQGQAASTVLTMRVAGIALCEIRGRLSDCQCLKDIADEILPNELKSGLDRVCNNYLAHAT
jgi:hypothetical protein